MCFVAPIIHEVIAFGAMGMNLGGLRGCCVQQRGDVCRATRVHPGVHVGCMARTQRRMPSHPRILVLDTGHPPPFFLVLFWSAVDGRLSCGAVLRVPSRALPPASRAVRPGGRAAGDQGSSRSAGWFRWGIRGWGIRVRFTRRGGFSGAPPRSAAAGRRGASLRVRRFIRLRELCGSSGYCSFARVPKGGEKSPRTAPRRFRGRVSGGFPLRKLS